MSLLIVQGTLISIIAGAIGILLIAAIVLSVIIIDKKYREKIENRTIGQKEANPDEVQEILEDLKDEAELEFEPVQEENIEQLEDEENDLVQDENIEQLEDEKNDLVQDENIEQLEDEKNDLVQDEIKEEINESSATETQDTKIEELSQEELQEKEFEEQEKSVPVEDDDPRQIEENGELFIIRYNKSFEAKLIQTETVNKDYYNELKNYLLSYQKIKARRSWKYETFKAGRLMIGFMEMRGKTLCLYLNLDPNKLDGTKYHVKEVNKKACATLLKVKSSRKCKYAKDLIQMVMEENNIPFVEESHVFFKRGLGRKSTKELIEIGLIKEVKIKDANNSFLKKKVVNGVIIKDDNYYLNLVELVSRKQNPAMRMLITTQELEDNFEDDDEVNLEEIKDKLPQYRKATYLKLVAEGELTKTLSVLFDDYSPEAIRQIVENDGKVFKTRK